MADRAPEGSVSTKAFHGKQKEIQNKMKQEFRTCQASSEAGMSGQGGHGLGHHGNQRTNDLGVMRLTKEKQVL